MTGLQEVPLGRWLTPEGEPHVTGVTRTRRRMRATLRELGLPQSASVEELCAAVAEHRGRPIRLIARRMRFGEPSGFVESLPHEDHIHYEAETSRLHQTLICCHELAHLLLGHVAAAPADRQRPEATVQLPTIDADMVRLVLGRSHYDDLAEEEAEVLGMEMMRRLVLTPGTGTTAQLAPALEHRRGQHV